MAFGAERRGTTRRCATLGVSARQPCATPPAAVSRLLAATVTTPMSTARDTMGRRLARRGGLEIRPWRRWRKRAPAGFGRGRDSRIRGAAAPPWPPELERRRETSPRASLRRMVFTASSPRGVMSLFALGDHAEPTAAGSGVRRGRDFTDPARRRDGERRHRRAKLRGDSVWRERTTATQLAASMADLASHRNAWMWRSARLRSRWANATRQTRPGDADGT